MTACCCILTSRACFTLCTGISLCVRNRNNYVGLAQFVHFVKIWSLPLLQWVQSFVNVQFATNLHNSNYVQIRFFSLVFTNPILIQHFLILIGATTQKPKYGRMKKLKKYSTKTKNVKKQAGNSGRVLNEPWEWYDKCARRDRNKGKKYHVASISF